MQSSLLGLLSCLLFVSQIVIALNTRNVFSPLHPFVNLLQFLISLDAYSRIDIMAVAYGCWNKFIPHVSNSFTLNSSKCPPAFFFFYEVVNG